MERLFMNVKLKADEDVEIDTEAWQDYHSIILKLVKGDKVSVATIDKAVWYGLSEFDKSKSIEIRLNRLRAEVGNTANEEYTPEDVDKYMKQAADADRERRLVDGTYFVTDNSDAWDSENLSAWNDEEPITSIKTLYTAADYNYDEPKPTFKSVMRKIWDVIRP